MSAVDNVILDNRIVGGLQSVITAKDVLTSRAADRLSLVGVTGYAADHLITFQDLGTDPNCHLFRIVEVKCGSV